MKNKAIIVDLDGTLALIERDPYTEQHLIMEDRLNGTLYDVVMFYKELGHDILIVTGRWEEHFSLTMDWLKQFKIEPTELLMRPVTNYDSGTRLKEWYLENIIQNKYDVVLAFEDVFKIAQMYRRHGVPCWQVSQDPYLKNEETVV